MKTNGKWKCKFFLYGSYMLCMLVCAGFTSPLYPHYIGHDSATFLTVAKGIVSGKIPYIDLFDHKGPVFFWMEALGVLFGGRTGVFLLQCLLFAIDFFLLERITGLLKGSFFVTALSFAALFFTLFQHGNLTEEFGLPFVLYSMYLELQFLGSGKEDHPPEAGFVYGLMLGMLSLIRLNNAAPMCALILCIAVSLICNKKWGNILKNIFTGILGLAAVAVPVCIYFYSHGALFDMLYGTFLHNLFYTKYATHYPLTAAPLYFLFLFLPGICASVIFWKKWRREKSRAYLSLLFSTLMTYGMLVYSNRYEHYFMIGIPLFAAAAAAMSSRQSPSESGKNSAVSAFLKEKAKLYGGGRCAALLIAVTCLYMGTSLLSACAPVYKTYLSDIAYNEYAQIQEEISVIPEEERDSVIGYNIYANFYYHADILPCYRYFTLQRWMTSNLVNVNREILLYIYHEHPLWVITDQREKSKTIFKILNESYELKYSDDLFSIYRWSGTVTEEQ